MIRTESLVHEEFLYKRTHVCTCLGDKGKIQKLVQMAWTFVNDRYVY